MEMRKDSLKRANQGLAALLCASLLFWAPNPHAWANPVVNAAAVRTVPAGVGHLGMAAMGAGAMQFKLSEVQLAPSQSSLGTQLLTVPDLQTAIPSQVPGTEGLRQLKAVPQAQAAASAQAVARHPVIELINEVQKAGGHEVLEKLSTAKTAEDISAIAEALPTGSLRATMFALAGRIAANGAIDGQTLNKAFDNDVRMTARTMRPAEPVAAPKGVWTWLSKSRLMPAPIRKMAAKKVEAHTPQTPMMDSDKLLIPVEKLRWAPDAKDLPASSKDIQAKEREIVGQDQALKSIDFGLKMEGPGYNLYVSGPSGSGRETSVRRLLRDIAPSKETPPDIVAATNFKDPSSPYILAMEPGTGRQFAGEVAKVIQTIAIALPQVLESDEFQQAAKQAQDQVKAAGKKAMAALDKQVSKIKLRDGFGFKIAIKELEPGRIGIMAQLTREGKEIKDEEQLAALLEGKDYTKDELVEELQAAAQPWIEKYGQVLQQQQEMAGQASEQLESIQTQAIGQLINQVGAGLIQAAGGSQVDPKALEAVKKKAAARQEAFDKEVSKTKIGPFDLGMKITQQGLSVFIGYEGKPVNQKLLKELQQAGKVDAGLSWDQVVAEAKEKAGPLIEKFKAMQAENQKDLIALKQSMPAPTPRQVAALGWVRSFLSDLVANYEDFLPREAPSGMAALIGGGAAAQTAPGERYKVSVLVDNAKTQGAPVIFERKPTFTNLFGEVADAKEVMMGPGGSMVQRQNPAGPTLTGGSFLKANGGYLVLNVMDVLREPNVYPSLMRMIRTGKAELVDGKGIYAPSTAYEIPSTVKVVLIGSPMIKMMLKQHDEDFAGLFRAAAEFASSMQVSADAIAGYLSFIRNMITRSTNELLEMTGEAMAGVLEYGAKLSGSNERLSTSFGSLAALLREATFWAKESGHDQVTRDDVDKALAERINREGGYYQRMIEMYTSDTFVIETKGKKVGQINGLAVIGEEFGVPARITVQTSAGGNGMMISADKNAGSAGPSFVKSLNEIEGYLEGVFAQVRSIPAKIRVAFEQNYGGIDGDSATQTMIYATISSLSRLPIQQGIAITGSADQWGNVQAIGGVNAKINGYYQVAKAKGFDGTQGVIIPESNIPELMLSPEIVEAVRQGKFKIWAVGHVSQGMEILMGEPYAEIIKKAQARLDSFRGRP